MELGVRIGIDLVEVQRVETMLAEHPDAESMLFSDRELHEVADSRHRIDRLSARFGAKEAVLKALGTGMARGMTWRDIETVTTPTGQPTLALHGGVAAYASHLGLDSWGLTLSHSGLYAIACAWAHPSVPRCEVLSDTDHRQNVGSFDSAEERM